MKHWKRYNIHSFLGLNLYTLLQQKKSLSSKLLPKLESKLEEKCKSIADFYDPQAQSKRERKEREKHVSIYLMLLQKRNSN